MVERAKGTREKGEGQGLKERGGERIRIWLVDDHPRVREGMRRLREGEGGLAVSGWVDSAEGAVEEGRGRGVLTMGIVRTGQVF